LGCKFGCTAGLLAPLFNSARDALSLLGLFFIWKALNHGRAWAFWAIGVAGLVLQVLAFVADAAIGTMALVPNFLLTAAAVAGLALMEAAFVRQEPLPLRPTSRGAPVAPTRRLQCPGAHLRAECDRGRAAGPWG
jgi:hypothetical protein